MILEVPDRKPRHVTFAGVPVVRVSTLLWVGFIVFALNLIVTGTSQ